MNHWGYIWYVELNLDTVSRKVSRIEIYHPGCDPDDAYNAIDFNVLYAQNPSSLIVDLQLESIRDNKDNVTILNFEPREMELFY